MPLVSVIIPSYNRKDELISCLNSVIKQDYQNLEIIVVDDNSNDGTNQIIKNMFSQVNLICDSVNCGPSYRRNQGILASNGEYLLFLDSDTELQEVSIISRMVDYLQKDGNIGELGGEIPFYEGEKHLGFGRNVTFTGWSYRVAAEEGDNQLTPCDYLATCNCMVKKEAAIKIGGFDPYYEFGKEDTDFGIALKKLGYANYVASNYSIYHKASKSGRHKDQTYRYRVMRIRFLLKHYGFGRFIVLFVIDFLRILTFYPLLPFKILAKLLLKKPIKGESFTGAWFILKAYIWNLFHLRETIKSRRADFLSPENMKRFRELKLKGRSL